MCSYLTVLPQPQNTGSMTAFRAMLASVVLTGLIAAQEHVSFPIRNGQRLFEWLNRPDDSPTPRQRDTAVSHADIGHPAISPSDRTARQFGVMMLLIDVSSQKK